MEQSIEEITEATLLPVLNSIEQVKNTEVIDSNEVLKRLNSKQ